MNEVQLKRANHDQIDKEESLDGDVLLDVPLGCSTIQSSQLGDRISLGTCCKFSRSQLNLEPFGRSEQAAHARTAVFALLLCQHSVCVLE